MSSLSQLILSTTVFVVCFTGSPIQAAVFQWTGLGSDAWWSNGDNWDQGGAIPGVADEVVLSANIPSEMDGDFTIGSLRFDPGFNSTMDFGNNILSIADSIDFQNSSASILSDSLELQFIPSALHMRLQDSLELQAIYILGDMSFYGNHGSLFITDEFFNDGVVEFNNLRSQMEGALWANNGTLNSTGLSYHLKVGSDSIVNWGVVSSNVTFFKQSRTLPSGVYTGDLVLSTEGALAGLEYRLDTMSYTISGALRVEIDSSSQFALSLSSDSALVNVLGDFITQNSGDTSFNAIELDLGASGMILQGDVYLHDLLATNPAIMGVNGSITHTRAGAVLEIENSSPLRNIFATFIIDQNVSIDAGLWSFGQGGLFLIDSNAQVMLDLEAGLTLVDSAMVQLWGDLQGQGEFHIQSFGALDLGDTVEVRTRFSHYTIEVPSIVYQELMTLEFYSTGQQIFMRFGAGDLELLGGLTVINDSSSLINHALDWATSDPNVLIRQNFIIQNNSATSEPFYLWGDGVITLDVDLMDWSTVGVANSSEYTFEWVGEGTSSIWPSQDTMPTFNKTGTDTTIILGRDLRVRSWVQNEGRLDLNGFNLYVSDHLGIDGDSTSLAPLDDSEIISLGDIILSGELNSPIQIRSLSSTRPHTLEAGVLISATRASIENSHVIAPQVGDAAVSTNLGANLRWNFSAPSGIFLSNDSVNDGAANPWFVGVVGVLDGADSLGNDSYSYEFSSLVDSVDNSVFRLSNDSLFFSQAPNIGLGDTYPVGLLVSDQTDSQFEDTLYVYLRDSSAFVVTSVDSMAGVTVFDLRSWQLIRSVASLSDTLVLNQGDYAQIHFDIEADSTVIEVEFHAQQLGLDSLIVLQDVGSGKVFRSRQFFMIMDSLALPAPRLERVWYLHGESEFVRDTSISTEPLIGVSEIWLDFQIGSRGLDLEELSVNLSQNIEVEMLLMGSQFRLKLVHLETIDGVVDMNIYFYPGAPELSAQFSLGQGEAPLQSWVGQRNLKSESRYRAVDGSQTGSSQSWGVWYAQ